MTSLPVVFSDGIQGHVGLTSQVAVGAGKVVGMRQAAEGEGWPRYSPLPQSPDRRSSLVGWPDLENMDFICQSLLPRGPLSSPTESGRTLPGS